MQQEGTSKRFWNAAARENAAWYIATKFQSESPEFFESGRREVDHLLDFAGVALGTDDTVVEIGCGAGRMTRRLSELAGSVIATDVSGEMLRRAAANLVDHDNVGFIELSGEGDLPLADGSATAVFSYITMQHVPTSAAQEAYFASALRVLAPGGWALIQFRRSGVLPRLLDWAGHFRHLLRGRRTLDRAWRGARVRESALLGYAASDLSVRILHLGRRHIWALARRS
ncbi:class I SAM-dependent methyltransferase [Diaminobutyricimonas sp. TR449]|uniref:class I SAM-dependent methyltransferase n=1 Tax=Diaminobutyricimonas sp. TR449 TaxID=2708076 RepID=UPI00141F5D04|nr:class I SAM-dependent methyltransferase [Diaminobutyricimonas sp. TR449]